MSSADPGPARPRRRRRRLLLAALAALLVGALVTTVLLVLERREAAPGRTGGEPGLGDPYFPRAGNSGYDVDRYTIDLDLGAGDGSLTGTTTFVARATQDLAWFWFDLALDVRAVQVDGAAAAVSRDGATDVRVQPVRPVPVGAEFSVRVEYAGTPAAVEVDGASPVHQRGAEWSVFGEPEASAWWFPADDHPSDPALVDVSVRVPAGVEAVSVGRLASRDTGDEADFDTWHWVAGQPMATYLAFVSVGPYRLEEGVQDGRSTVYAVSEQLTGRQQRAALDRLRTSGATVRVLETMFGPYPFTELGGVVPSAPLEFGALETQTRPVYDARAITDADFAPELLAHELAHQWFGDQVTLRAWDDVVNSEGWASWVAWAVVERTGGPSAAAAFERTYAAARSDRRIWSVDLTDPGRDHLFDAVYTRGPLALQALRTLIGDEAFFGLARDWTSRPATRSFEEWQVQAQAATAVDLGPYFAAWYQAPTAPEPSPALGFP
ncbi:Peptidase family M1 [Friedmanniella luteola]|uniref:Aminopeptidase N n=1 Tax=Friedmanniella luteola TaxID=546871 RepID=A0A1H1X5M1_9ACTN|nr:M1 family metallopeptidase [Friedmanniella luteola]SDT03926.1 Peptidase family M1 [Friedmanniella luteola]